MQRILIVGCGGAGKSRLARQLSTALGLPLIGLDRAYWRPGWVEPPKEEWRETIRKLAAEPAWVMDGNYSGTFDLRMPRVDTLVWLDYPRITCLRRVLMRSLKDYGRARADLPDSCPEKIDLKFFRWIWKFQAESRPRILAGIEQFGAHLRVLRLVNDRAVAAFLRAPVECPGEPGTRSPRPKCANEEAAAISAQVSRPSRSNSVGNGCRTA